MAIKTLRVFAEYTSTGFVPMPTAGGIDYGYTLASTFPSATPSSFQTDDPDIDVTVTAMTDFYVWIRINGTAWNPSYTRNVRVYPDSPDINSVVMNMIIATGPAGTSAYSQIVQTSNRLYFNGATADSTYNSKFAGKTYINELNFGTAPGLATVATTGAYADLTGKPALSTVATTGSYADLSNKPSGTAPISYNSGTNSFQISVASASTNGYLTSTDWSTFNAKYLLPSGGTTAQYLRGDGTLATFPTTLDSTRLIFTGKNATGSTLTKGTVVYINGVSGNTALLAKAIASGDSTSAQTLGVVEFDIANNQSGVVVLVGSVANLDTSSFTEGVQLYLSGTTAGAFTSSKVLAPTHLVYVGIVTRAHPTQGTIEVKIQNGYELDEIHDVQISSPADKDILYRDSASSLWKHASIASVLGYTPYNATNPNNYIALTALSASAPLSYNNTTGAFTISQANTTTNGFLSSTDWNTFNSKQSALTLGNVSEVSSNVLMFPDGGTGKTIGNLTIQVVQASASTNGFLSSTNWTTFNNKQNAITLTTTGSSGASTFASNTLNIPQYQGVVTLTTTGTSGAATFSANTLNIPQYQSVLTNPVTGTGTSGYHTKWTSSSAIGNSLLFENSSAIGLNVTPKTWYNTSNHYAIQLGQLGALIGGNDAMYVNSNYYFDATGAGKYIATGFASSYRQNGGIHSFFTAPSGTADTATTMTERLTITQSGNVGIGTSSPSNLGSLTVVMPPSSNQTGLVIKGMNDGGVSSQPALTFLNGSSNYTAQIWSDSASAMLAFSTGASNVERVRITNIGSVGIGTTTPSNGYGGTIDNVKLALKNGTAGSANGMSVLLIGGDDSHYSSITGQHIGGGNTYLSFGTSTGAANPTEKMRITSGGLVGIGTSSPNSSFSKLDVAGNIMSSGGSTIFMLNNTNGTPQMWWVGQDTAGNGDGIFYIYNFTSGIPALHIRKNNNVLIGSTTDSGERLYVGGSIRATGNITANSDLTLKKNLQLIDNAAEKLMSLNGYSYQWKDNNEFQYGVVAQEVEKVMSYAVQTGNNGIKGVAYNQLTPLLIEGFKVHETELQTLKKRVAYLETKLG